MATYLDAIVERKRADLDRAKAAVPLADLKARAADMPPPLDFRGALDAPGIQVIAEVKKASPSRGDIAPDADHVATARAYAAAGAAAISVLTEEPHFKGRLSYLTDIKNGLGDACPPLLRKDFIVDPYQVYEARAYGADALLLIVASLTDGELAELMGPPPTSAWGAWSRCTTPRKPSAPPTPARRWSASTTATCAPSSPIWRRRGACGPTSARGRRW